MDVGCSSLSLIKEKTTAAQLLKEEKKRMKLNNLISFIIKVRLNWRNWMKFNWWSEGWRLAAKERAANSISFNSFLFENEKRKKEIGLFACGAHCAQSHSFLSSNQMFHWFDWKEIEWIGSLSLSPSSFMNFIHSAYGLCRQARQFSFLSPARPLGRASWEKKRNWMSKRPVSTSPN